MTRGSGFLRDNAFLAGAVMLPAVVAAFFVAANAIPRWMVPDPRFDLLFRVVAPFDGSDSTRRPVEFAARDGQVQATFRRPAADRYVQTWVLLRYDHATRRVSEVEIGPPGGLAEGESRTVVVESLKAARVLSSETAPDGYTLVPRASRGSGGGLVGDLFGMRRYRDGVAVTKDGRVIRLDLPAAFAPSYQEALAVGWVADGSAR